jgi:hypothetical protein
MASDNSFLDLRAGGRLKVVVPVFNSGHDRMIFSPGQAKDGSITLSAAGLAGYQSSYYATVGSADGTVRLRFQSAETAIDGVKTSMAKAPELPFALPAKRQHLRLLYLVRQSLSDHNMAIVGSKRFGSAEQLYPACEERSESLHG